MVIKNRCGGDHTRTDGYRKGYFVSDLPHKKSPPQQMLQGRGVRGGGETRSCKMKIAGGRSRERERIKSENELQESRLNRVIRIHIDEDSVA